MLDLHEGILLEFYEAHRRAHDDAQGLRRSDYKRWSAEGVERDVSQSIRRLVDRLIRMRNTRVWRPEMLAAGRAARARSVTNASRRPYVVCSACGARSPTHVCRAAG